MTLEKTRENLEKRGFESRIFQTKEEAAAYLNEQIDQTTVGFGGSVTLKEMNLFETLKSHNEVWWHNYPGQVEEFGAEPIRVHAAAAEIYVTSANGVSEQGQLINIDGYGNRIAATAYGHKKIYFVIGKNKIADNFEQALWRARNIACPKNAQRIGVKTPCAVKGDKCYDCSSPQRICRGFMILERPTTSQQYEILLVNEDLGY